MKIIFIHHSCFVAEVDEKIFIFDWFEGSRVNGYHFNGVLPEYVPETPVYVFASHKHQDHFDIEVLRLAEKYENIHFILSKDCKMSPNYLKKHGIDPSIREKITYVTIRAKYQIEGGGQVETFRSTDAGVAFLIEVNGVRLFHAGDLNDWSFPGADDLTTWKMRREFQAEIKRLKNKEIQIAFIPADPRLGKNQWNAMDFFLEQTDAKLVFPMHMWQDYSGIEVYLRQQKDKEMAERIVPISCENEEFDILIE